MGENTSILTEWLPYFLFLNILKIQSSATARVPLSTTPSVVVKPCHDPLPMRNGSYRIWGQNLLIEYHCDEGFFPLGATFGTCNPLTKRWSARPPRCVAPGCPELVAPSKGQMYLEYNKTKVTVFCDDGYRLIGKRVRYCDGKTWRGAKPRCISKYTPGRNRQQQRDVTTTTTPSPQDLVQGELKKAVAEADDSCYHSYSSPPEVEHANARIGYQYNAGKRFWVLIANYTCQHGYRLAHPHQQFMYCKNFKWVSLNDDGPKCIEATTERPDPCSKNNGGCDHICTSRGFGRYQCACREGFVLGPFNRRCQDVDECRLYNGHCEQDCHNTLGSYFCTCRQGYIASGTDCFDVDECTSQKSHLCPGRCINIPGSYTCDCHTPGYQARADSGLCQDIDECGTDNGGCQGQCVNEAGSYRCRCDVKGYKLAEDRHNCTDVDECVRYKNKVCRHGDCINTNGSYECSCHHGYVANKVRKRCLDIDECLENNGGCEGLCTNVPGGVICSCLEGYALTSNNRSCEDVDECMLENGGCEDVCVNTQGSFYCRCQQPLMVVSHDNRTCTGCNVSQYMDVERELCVNCPPHSYRTDDNATSLDDCRCQQGFENSGNTSLHCSDIDECSTGQLSCHHTCHNTAGTAYCACLDGYQLAANGTCIDIDECRNETWRACNQTCWNQAGGFNCSCGAGYLLGQDGTSCDDIDECADDSLKCGHTCVNTYGGAECRCPEGYHLQGDGTSCTDLDECAAGTSVCEDVCINEEGSYRCDCGNPGYKLSWDRASCVDINECMEGSNLCEEDCENTVGSYTCSCSQKGFIVDPENTTRCIDLNECDSEDTNVCRQVCVNVPGSYRCDCRPGYALYSFSACAACYRNFYRTPSDPECVRCPRYSGTRTTAAASLSQCKCRNGYHGNVTAGEPCTRTRG